MKLVPLTASLVVNTDHVIKVEAYLVDKTYTVKIYMAGDRNDIVWMKEVAQATAYSEVSRLLKLLQGRAEL